MDAQQKQQVKKERGEEEEEESKQSQSANLYEDSSTTTISCSPPSPSYEFSFTNPLQPSSTHDKTKSLSSSAIDLSPADEIFFHGHLLPLHLLSHLPISTTSSFDYLTTQKPITELVLEHQKPTTITTKSDDKNNTSSINDQNQSNNGGTKKRIKAKSFSIFRPAKWRKQCENEDKKEEDTSTTTTTKTKVKFDASNMLKRYLRMVKPLLFFKGKNKKCELNMKSHSFSTNSSSKLKQEERGIRRNSVSAPASLQTSAKNSGSSLSRTTVKFPSSVNDHGSMEELQNAIESAIAHCKNSSITNEKQLKSHY